MSRFVHLHNHTHYSILDALTTTEELAKAAADDGQSAVALTDHGVIFGLMEFQKSAKTFGVKPIFGMEAYIAEKSRFDRQQTDKIRKIRNYYHLILMAKDLTGYKNLVKLTSMAHTEGFYYRPRIDKELLEKYKDGLIATSACLGGVVSAHLIDEDYKRAVSEAQYYKDLFGDDFYLEIQNHHLKEDPKILTETPKIATELGIKLIATNDIHYLKKEHSVAHNVYLLIKDTSAADADKVDIKNLRYHTDEFYFRSQDEMIALFKDTPEAISNTLEIADKCDLTLKFNVNMPEFSIPKESKSTNLNEYLEELVFQGLKRKYPEITVEIEKRAKYELEIIKNMGFPDYFLIVYDFIKAARDRNIRVGPGRGSAAGSIVAYALDITSCDPLPAQLLFERFLNPERVSLPDIDIDFDDERRAEVIEYCQEKYGKEAVAQIITFGKMSSRMVLKDVGRVLGVPLADINNITSRIPVKFGKVAKLEDALKLADLKQYSESKDPKIKQLIEYSLILEDKNRSAGTHAAGVVITPGAVNDFVPVFYNNKTSDEGISIATQYTMKYIEDAGVIKMDFLGLRTLSIIDRAVQLIKINYNIDLNIDSIPMDDKKTFELIASAKTTGVFQFESGGMQDYLKKLKPNSLEELTAMNALYRPGPMENIPEFIDRKHGLKPITYLHPIMEQVLNNTYGIIVYQEQVMQLVQVISNFTLGEADILRRAMGKKQIDEIEKMKPKFFEGAESNGISQKIANEIFELILKFANYGFNKSHSYVYSWVAYQTAYLKAHFPAEFLAANMTAELNNQEKIVSLIDEAKNFGLQILPPDINTSIGHFSVKGKNIYFGLAAIKGIGMNPVNHIVEIRKNGLFTSFFDFVKRTDPKFVNRRVLESLIFAGAFDSIADEKRRPLYEVIDDALNFAKAQNKNDGMFNLFAGNNDLQVTFEPSIPDIPDWNNRDRLDHEKGVLNFYVSGHPLNEFKILVKSFSHKDIFQYLDEEVMIPKNEKVRFCGLISSIRTRRDKQNRMIAFVQIEDFVGKVECIFWSEAYSKYEDILVESSPITVYGKLDPNDNLQLKIIAEEAYSFLQTLDKFATGIVIKLIDNEKTEKSIFEIHNILSQLSGKELKIVFILENDEKGEKKQFVAFDYATNLNFQVLKQLQQVECVKKVKLLSE
ncbi:MAG: DNA polymerase III subunit alpha [Ignavibacteria bacterium GWF2_33_9]|nr:MAG: DNA polymerase III subunit alpha [Ignavibacteria bacterium GWF2_33_9]